MAETLSTLSIISFVLAGVGFILAVFFWFFFKIPSVIGDLTGKTAKKSIAKMRAANEKSGVKSYRESKFNSERGKITETIPNINKSSSFDEDNQRPETGLLDESKAEYYEIDATQLLVDDEATVPLEKSTPIDIATEPGVKMTIIDEVTLIHTDEVIE